MATASPEYGATKCAGETYVPINDPAAAVDDAEEDAGCAQIGCFMALFLPIAGLITLLWNVKAHPFSLRARWAQLAWRTGLFVILATIFSHALTHW